jgi:HD superfamily phosphohydrolase/serine/threonine protein kinase
MAKQRKRQSIEEMTPVLSLDDSGAPAVSPDFEALLRQPVITSEKLPSDFDASIEAAHIVTLWTTIPRLRKYRFDRFVHAGGSGMVFKTFLEDTITPRALKIARAKLFTVDVSGGVASSLSPVSESELQALEKISHPNVVRLYDAIENERGVVAIATTYIEAPKSLDSFLHATLDKDPDPKRTKGIHPFSPRRLDDACRFILDRCVEISSAIQHMHSLQIFHFDIKPANILLSEAKGAPHWAMLTDMGACVDATRLPSATRTRVHFTWTYAHPDLTDIVNDPSGISGGGLKASASVRAGDALSKYDLFAFGKTIQEMLAILATEFGERCHASYAFRFLHIIGCLLLDGRNVAPASGEEGHSDVLEKHGRRFVTDSALGYPIGLFIARRITTASELTARLNRFSREYSWNHMAPELDAWQPELINSVAHSPAPFTERVAALLNHPAVRRLKDEPQLGWMREVYPGATHDRWSHSLGVFSATVGFYNSLLSDPELPTLRILVNRKDISHAFVAALLHDLGQSTFGHDLEEACPFLFSHEEIVMRLLDEETWGAPTLSEVINRHWPEVERERLDFILTNGAGSGDANNTSRDGSRVLDGLARDVIKGPIDADKLDYLLRDSIFCGVSYGHGIDVPRFLRALTVSSIEESYGVRLALAYKAKGRAAVTSVLLARYQMFGSVYWHHTFRCIQAMFVDAAAATFGALEHQPRKLRGLRVKAEEIKELLYHRIVCGKSWERTLDAAQHICGPAGRWFAIVTGEAPPAISADRAMEFLWRFADDGRRELMEKLAKRQLYKRAFELRLGELGERADYSALKADLSPLKRKAMAVSLQTQLMDAVQDAMRERGPSSESISEQAARDRVQELKKESAPLVLIDFPVRGIGTDSNTPMEIGDATRKYFVLPRGHTHEDNVFSVVSRLQQHWATLRLFVSPELHELVIRYLHPRKIEGIVQSVIPKIRHN